MKCRKGNLKVNGYKNPCHMSENVNFEQQKKKGCTSEKNVSQYLMGGGSSIEIFF